MFIGKSRLDLMECQLNSLLADKNYNEAVIKSVRAENIKLREDVQALMNHLNLVWESTPATKKLVERKYNWGFNQSLLYDTFAKYAYAVPK